MIRDQVTATLSGKEVPGGSFPRISFRRNEACPAGQLSLMDTINLVLGFPPQERSGSNDGTFRGTLFATDRAAFVESMYLSYGSLGEVVITTINETTTIELTPLDYVDGQVDLRRKVAETDNVVPDIITNVTSLGRMYDDKGGLVLVPQISKDITQVVYGLVRVTYFVTGYERSVTVPPRDGGENPYEATLYIVSPTGEIEEIDLEIPDCWYPGDTGVTSQPPEARARDLNFSWELCGKKKAANSETTKYFKAFYPDANEICYPGVDCNDVEGAC